MQLTRKSEIAIDILCACAADGNRMIATKEAAEAAVATKDHAAQVVRILVNAGYLCSVRGRTGGIRLQVAPSNLRTGDILCLMQPDFVPTEDIDASSMQPGHRRKLTDILRRAQIDFLSSLGQRSLADLLSDDIDERSFKNENARMLRTVSS